MEAHARCSPTGSLCAPVSGCTRTAAARRMVSGITGCRCHAGRLCRNRQGTQPPVHRQIGSDYLARPSPESSHPERVKMVANVANSGRDVSQNMGEIWFHPVVTSPCLLPPQYRQAPSPTLHCAAATRSAECTSGNISVAGGHSSSASAFAPRVSWPVLNRIRCCNDALSIS